MHRTSISRGRGSRSCVCNLCHVCHVSFWGSTVASTLLSAPSLSPTQSLSVCTESWAGTLATSPTWRSLGTESCLAPSGPSSSARSRWWRSSSRCGLPLVWCRSPPRSGTLQDSGASHGASPPPWPGGSLQSVVCSLQCTVINQGDIYWFWYFGAGDAGKICPLAMLYFWVKI